MALFGRKKEDATPEVSAAVEPEVIEAVPPVQRTIDEQRAFMLDGVQPIRPFGMQLWDIEGLTLCEDIVSDLDLPLVTTARVAGWGVRGSDLVGASEEAPRSLFVVDRIAEGEKPGAPLVAGAAVAVEEGAILPEGVDAVVPLGEGRVEGDYVVMTSEAHLYQHLRRAGSELADGTPLVASGTTLTARAVALLAEVGLDKVLVRPRPRVVVLTVGDTLVPPGQPLTEPQQRYDSTTPLLAAAARADGATVYPLGVVAATTDAIRRAIKDQQIRADLVLVVGGGDASRDAVRDLGDYDEAEVLVNGGDYVAFVRMGDAGVPLVVLPGGAVSAFVGYQLFVRPVIQRLNDVDPDGGQRVEGIVPVELEARHGSVDCRPAVLGAGGDVRPTGELDSELALDLAQANVLMVVPQAWGGVQPGSRVECIVLDETLLTRG